MARPISKRMLTCSAILYTKQELDADRNVTWSNPVALSSIWITTTRATSNGSSGAQTSDTMVLFYDSVNSSAKENDAEVEVSWQKGAKVVFNGFDYYINSITPCYCSGGIHHYEIGLV